MDEIEYVLACFILWNFICWYRTLWACEIFNQIVLTTKIDREPLFHNYHGHGPTFYWEAHLYVWIWPETNLFRFELDYETCAAANSYYRLAKSSIRLLLPQKLMEKCFSILTMIIDPLFAGRHTHMSRFGQKRTCSGSNLFLKLALLLLHIIGLPNL